MRIKEQETRLALQEHDDDEEEEEEDLWPYIEKVTRRWRKFHTEELRDVLSFLNIIKGVVKQVLRGGQRTLQARGN